MELFLVVITAIAIWYLWPRKRGPRRSPAALERERREGPSRADLFPAPNVPRSPASPKPKRTIPDHLVFAAELIGDDFHARTREQVDSMFSGAREELPRVRSQGKAALRLAHSYEEAAKKAKPASPPDLSSFRTALAKVEFMIAECERILDSLYFDNDDDSRYQKLLDGLEDAHSDLEGAISDIEQTTKDIASGEYDAFWVEKPKPIKKPRR